MKRENKEIKQSIIPEFSSESSTHAVTQEETKRQEWKSPADSPQVHGLSNNIHGFTLIEILVAVLIIAVLAAIALPAYQKAVWKSRSAEVKVMANNLLNAESVYRLHNGEYTRDFSELDIRL